MLRISSRPLQVLISDALQVWCRLANHVNIYTADRIHKTNSVMLEYILFVDQYYPRKDCVQRYLVY